MSFNAEGNMRTITITYKDKRIEKYNNITYDGITAIGYAFEVDNKKEILIHPASVEKIEIEEIEGE